MKQVKPMTKKQLRVQTQVCAGDKPTLKPTLLSEQENMGKQEDIHKLLAEYLHSILSNLK